MLLFTGKSLLILPCLFFVLVIHRIGGLENVIAEHLLDYQVVHRIGGLEICL